VNQGLCLPLDCFDDLWVAVSAGVYSDSCEAVDVNFPFRVPDQGAAAAGEVEGLAGVGGLEVFCFGFYGGHGEVPRVFCCVQCMVHGRDSCKVVLFIRIFA